MSLNCVNNQEKENEISKIEKNIELWKKTKLKKLKGSKEFEKFDQKINNERLVAYNYLNSIVKEMVNDDKIKTAVKRCSSIKGNFEFDNSLLHVLWDVNYKNYLTESTIMFYYFMDKMEKIQKSRDINMTLDVVYSYRLAFIIKIEEIEKALKGIDNYFSDEKGISETLDNLGLFSLYMNINNNIKEKISEIEERINKVISEKDKAIEKAFKVYEEYYEDKKKEMLKEIGVDYKQKYLE